MSRKKITAKVCIIGDAQSGKTAFASCSPLERVSYIYNRPMGINLYHHGPFIVGSPTGVTVNILLWEIGLQRHTHALRNLYLKGCSAAFVMCDMGKETPFERAMDDVKEIRDSAPKADIHLIANKIDLRLGYDFSLIEKQSYKVGISFHKISCLNEAEVEPLYVALAERIALKASRTERTSRTFSPTLYSG